MSFVVWKFKMPAPGWTDHHEIPQVANTLAVGMQGADIVLWCEVNPDWPTKKRVDFFTIGTGWEVPPSTSYVGTVQDAGGFVWHVYERGMAEPA